jgi:hypothetical protein
MTYSLLARFCTVMGRIACVEVEQFKAATSSTLNQKFCFFLVMSGSLTLYHLCMQSTFSYLKEHFQKYKDRNSYQYLMALML